MGHSAFGITESAFQTSATDGLDEAPTKKVIEGVSTILE
jgi:hypothetical protein